MNTARDGILGDLRQQRHHGVSVLAVERRRRLVGENDGRIADDGARDRDALLLAAAELARKRVGLVRKPDGGECLVAPWRARRGERSPRTSSASRTFSAAVSVGNR